MRAYEMILSNHVTFSIDVNITETEATTLPISTFESTTGATTDPATTTIPEPPRPSPRPGPVPDPSFPKIGKNILII